MLAYRFDPSSTDPVQKRLPIPIPARDEVLVKILAGGVCHSDVSVLDPTSASRKGIPPTWCPFTFGHEGAGIVTSLGSDVATTHSKLAVGAYVAIFSANPCSKSNCRACPHGFDNLCVTHRPYGLGADGSWAAYASIRADALVLIPEGPEVVLPGVAAAATDAVLTPYHAMKELMYQKPGLTVICYGIGGLGLNGVAIAKQCFGAKCVIACDRREEVLQDAKAFGADYTATPGELVKLVRTIRLVVDFAFDFVGSQATFDACYSAVRMGGTIHLIGIHSPSIKINSTKAMAKDLVYKTAFLGTRVELVEVLQLIADGVLKPKVETRPMSECAQVLEEMRQGKLRARIALIPDAEHSSL
ncbi:hypothetical protein PHLGIDRAFT_28634 [Phlebiopsis gigantea 11061_1 CR5-6]|uniref:Enoyl reductase (ER) domain-containing protein n=1 Tax=Phlebiopsis gigantea (strain 11061_1 CR5-6) TaxID=745531 RepID=A0A0C3NXD8_PHLG1|nr:hypothetical protein PHLGIDRAFT_28634 [Phlebiopsis gigantea 11061_1 CR5-6]